MKHPFFNTIRKKTIFIIACFIISLAMVFGLLVQFVLLNGFIQLENNNTLGELEQTLANLQNEVNRIDSIAGDWGPWDDTYDFMRDRNQGYIDSNLTDASVANLNINLFVLVDNQGQIIYQKGYDIENDQTTDIPAGFQDYVMQHPALFNHLREDSSLAGIVDINGKAFILASHPIVTSQFTGPIEGSLFVGRYLDSTALALIMPTRVLGLDYQSMLNAPANSTYVKMHTTLLKNNSMVVKPLNRHTLEAFAIQNDIFGAASFVFRLTTARVIYQHGMKNLTVFFLVFTLTGSVFGLIFLASIDRVLLARLRAITRTVSLIKSTSDLSLRVRIWGQDELSTLAHQINDTFETLSLSSKKLEENQLRLEYEAHHDTLTGFPNRAYFMSRLNQALRARQEHGNKRCAVLFLDLDRFKLVNDSFDHDFGDRLLVELSSRLARCIRNNDFISRFGGDEFVILLDNVVDENSAIEIADRIKGELALPFTIRGTNIFVTASIGITFPDTYDRSEDALRNADIAMYRAKAEGRDRYALFEHGLHATNFTRLELETELRRGLAENEFDVFYQPILSLSDGRVIGVEALVRWHHPQRGLLLPGEFLPTAEETGLINPLSNFIAITAFDHLKQLHALGQTGLIMSINCSYQVLRQPDFIEWVTKEIAKRGIDPKHLQMELTENTVMSDFQPMVDTLHKLKESGIQLALDDFGTGYSTLEQIKSIPADCLKIDRAFMSNLTQPGGDQAIVTAVIAMAHLMGMCTVAEGVETQEQARFLAKLGCNFAQGYYFSRPVPFQQMLTFLKQISSP